MDEKLMAMIKEWQRLDNFYSKTFTVDATRLHNFEKGLIPLLIARIEKLEKKPSEQETYAEFYRNKNFEESEARKAYLKEHPFGSDTIPIGRIEDQLRMNNDEAHKHMEEFACAFLKYTELPPDQVEMIMTATYGDNAVQTVIYFQKRAVLG